MIQGILTAKPVLVVGMHRSGTRLIDRILDRLGVFMGADRQADGESVTFMQINETVFHQCGTFWSEPMPVHFVLSQPELLERMAEVVVQSLATQLRNYAGRADLDLARIGELAPFGWKDPRNTFTLPVWQKIFPEARIIHVVRHGVDVAASLARRHGNALRNATGAAVPPALTVIQDHGLGVLSSRRGWTISEALTMWEQYVEKARLEAAQMGPRALEIRFEDLLERPQEFVPRIAQFCGVALPDDLDSVTGAIDAGRAYAFRQDAQLKQFAESAAAIIGRLGYEP